VAGERRILERTVGAFSQNARKVSDVAGKAGKRHQFKPDLSAAGDHSRFRQNLFGRTDKYQTYLKETNIRNPNPWKKGISYHEAGGEHLNKVTGKSVGVPHVHDPLTPGGIRKPYSFEIPR